MRNIIKILSLFFAISFCFADNPVILGYQALFLTASRAPTANEISLTDLFISPVTIQDYPGIFMWIDTATNQIYDYVSGGAGSLVWVQRGYTAPARVFTAITPSLNSATQISTTRDVFVSYPVDIQIGAALISNSSGTAALVYSNSASCSSGITTVAQGTNAASGIVSLVNTATVNLSGVIPAGKYACVTTTVNTGTVSFTARPGQEVSL